MSSITTQTWMAKGGTPVTIRSVRKGDFDIAQEFVRGLSPVTGYQRLMSSRKPSPEEVRRWTDIDPACELALIATVNAGGRERQVGVARCVIGPTTREAEFAIVLDDAWHGRGLGRELLSRLLVAAQQAGLHRIVGTTFSDNVAMVTLARRAGFKSARVPGAAMITALSLDLSTWTLEGNGQPELVNAA